MSIMDVLFPANPLAREFTRGAQTRVIRLLGEGGEDKPEWKDTPQAKWRERNRARRNARERAQRAERRGK